MPKLHAEVKTPTDARVWNRTPTCVAQGVWIRQANPAALDELLAERIRRLIELHPTYKYGSCSSFDTI